MLSGDVRCKWGHILDTLTKNKHQLLLPKLINDIKGTSICGQQYEACPKMWLLPTAKMQDGFFLPKIHQNVPSIFQPKIIKNGFPMVFPWFSHLIHHFLMVFPWFSRAFGPKVAPLRNESPNRAKHWARHQAQSDASWAKSHGKIMGKTMGKPDISKVHGWVGWKMAT